MTYDPKLDFIFKLLLDEYNSNSDILNNIKEDILENNIELSKLYENYNLSNVALKKVIELIEIYYK